MKSSSNQTAEQQLLDIGKEFWGVLFFERNLPALYSLIRGDKMGIGLNRLADWVLFPEKIPADSFKEIKQKLENRHESSEYIDSNYEMSESESQLHSLVIELLRIKYSGNDVTPELFKHLYVIPENMFIGILTQMVEHQYITSHKVMELHHYYTESKVQQDDEDDIK